MTLRYVPILQDSAYTNVTCFFFTNLYFRYFLFFFSMIAKEKMFQSSWNQLGFLRLLLALIAVLKGTSTIFTNIAKNVSNVFIRRFFIILQR